MSTFWISLSVTLAGAALAFRLGGPVFVSYAAATFVLPHVLIGDAFHWRHFPEVSTGKKMLWIALVAAGLMIFLVFRRTGDFMWPLFYIYFLGHVWKDMDIGMGRVGTDAAALGLRTPKRWCGIIVLTFFAVLSSGLVRDPFIIGLASRIAWAASAALFIFWMLAFGRARSSGEALHTAWARYLGFTAIFLLVCTWFNALRPDWRMFPSAIIVWHFVQWYVFYWWEAKKESSTGHSLRGLTTLIIAVNMLAVAGATVYAVFPVFYWLKYVFNFAYLSGCLTLVHVTLHWMPSQVKGVRVSV